ncbi:MAG: phosphate acetyltransferase [Gemmatimonadales bacterium]|nr:MAG: phosphate acetyltransferase [Gemmatimonadales bacterium]
MTFLEDVRNRARNRPRRIVLPEGDDPRTLKAVAEIQSEGLAVPVVLGDPARVRDGLAGAGGDPDSLEVVDPRVTEGTAPLSSHLWTRQRSRGMTEGQAREDVRDPLLRGALMVATGRADGSVAGAAHSTADVLRAALRAVGPADGIRTISSAFYMVLDKAPGRNRETVLTFTDCAVVPDPDPGALSQIAAAAARARRAVVGDSPVVAFLSYSTLGSAGGPSVEKVREALALFRDMEPGVPSDGELQGDSALVEAVARRKAPHSAVGGQANILVFPNLDAGNIAYKLVERLAGARAIGPVVQGLRKPCNDLSRGATPSDIVDVTCITSLMAP